MLIGNVGRDPEVRYLDGSAGQAKVATFTLATTERYRDRNGETRENTEWHNIVAWRNTAEFICKYFQKGSMIAFRGEIQTRTYQDEGGKNRKVTEIMVEEASFCGTKNESGSTGNQSGYESPAYSNGTDNNFEEVTGDDGLPF